VLAVHQVRRTYPDLATISLMARVQTVDSLAGGPSLCEYCLTRHCGYQEHYLA
jgi:hypothetical protein